MSDGIFFFISSVVTRCQHIFLITIEASVHQRSCAPCPGLMVYATVPPRCRRDLAEWRLTYNHGFDDGLESRLTTLHPQYIPFVCSSLHPVNETITYSPSIPDALDPFVATP